MVKVYSKEYKNLKNVITVYAKPELDLEYLLRCRDNNVISNFLNFLVSSQSINASLT